MAITGCGGGGSGSTIQPPITVTLGSASVVVPQDGTAVQMPVNITGASGSPTVTVTGLPAGVTDQFTAASAGTSGTLTLTGGATVPAGSYSAGVQVTLGTQNASQGFTLISAVTAKVGSSVDTAQGVNGVLKQFMSTSFQIGGWTTDYFGSGAAETAKEATLTQLGPQHIRVQVVAGAIPMVANTGNASDWDFTLLDTTLQPVLETADHSPELQIAVAPAWMCDSNGTLDIANHLNDFAAFSANMVRYYNKGGFDVNGTHFQSPSATPIEWWGIFNEFNGNGLSAADYVELYNAVVPAMLAVDPTIKLSALEFSDYGLGTGDGGDPMVYLPPFLAQANAGGVNTQVDVLSTHFYSTCNQKDTDTELFATVPQFAANVKYFYQELQTRPDLASVPVWVTENNVNADWSNNGMSECNPGQVFVTDTRGTTAYFAAWRPYVFSQLGKAGNQALYHWDYTADQQYSEVDANGNPYLSYWVDKTLESLYPSTVASPGPQILALSATDTSSVEMLATKDTTGAVTVMVVDRAVHAASDNNGSGDPRTVVVDLTSMGSFSSAAQMTIGAATNIVSGPLAVSVAPDSRMTVTLPGYGVTFLILKP
ncbi:MAG: hypothetical protein ABR905_06840 [Terracidiphilus sp.]